MTVDFTRPGRRHVSAELTEQTNAFDNIDSRSQDNAERRLAGR